MLQTKRASAKLTQSTPKLIVKGIKETGQLTELMQLASNLQLKNFDVAKFGEGVISLNFLVQAEAEDFGRFLQTEKGYEVELTLIRELYEIAETDETGERNHLYNKADGSVGCNSEGQRRMGPQILLGDDAPINLSGQSPMTPGGTRPLNSARFRNNGAPALNTITSSMSSGGEFPNNQ